MLVLAFVLSVAGVGVGAGAGDALAAGSTSSGSRADANLLTVYQNTGTIPPCRFTIAQLSHALRSIDTFDSVYFEDFPTAIKAALAARAGGACRPGANGATIPAGATVATGPSVGLPSGSVTGGTGASLPLPLLLLAILALAFAFVTGVTAVARAQGADPAWAAALRHTFSETGYRLEGAWEGFADWLRSGSRRR
jgi:hypothetical protein